jgi:hypothetical protein
MTSRRPHPAGSEPPAREPTSGTPRGRSRGQTQGSSSPTEAITGSCRSTTPAAADGGNSAVTVRAKGNSPGPLASPSTARDASTSPTAAMRAWCASTVWTGPDGPHTARLALPPRPTPTRWASSVSPAVSRSTSTTGYGSPIGNAHGWCGFRRWPGPDGSAFG